MVFLACGGVCLARAHAIPAERTAWSLIGIALVCYASGSVVYNVDLASDAAISFPSRADTLWLALYPLCFAGMVSLVRARHVQVNASLWLDAVIGGSAVAALAAAFVLPPVFERAVGEGWESAARLAYPLCDLVLTGFAVVLWGAGRWRFDTWLALAVGFALIAVGDSAYVVAQTGEGWVPGSVADLGYAAGTMLVAVAAWRSQQRQRGVPNSRVGLPIAFTVTSFGLVSYEVFAELDTLAVALIRLTRSRRPAPRAHAVVALAPARRSRGARGLGPADRAGQLPRLPGAPRRDRRRRSRGRRHRARPRPLQGAERHLRACEGDRVLEATATALPRTVEEPGFVARVGGEEFAILVPGGRRAGTSSGSRSRPCSRARRRSPRSSSR